jgi:uncharacterized protein
VIDARSPSTLTGPFEVVDRQPHPLAFVTVSGSHLYGFPSADSDIDLRGVHVLPIDEALGLFPYRETIEDAGGAPLQELVTHDLRKYCLLTIRNNGYVLEQIFSPLVAQTSWIHDELKALARRAATRNHAKHYLGFGTSEWTQFHRRPEKHVKRLLYVFRVLMTGVHLMRTGEVEANIVVLNEHFQLPYIPELIAQKVGGYEKGELAAGHGLDFYQREYNRMLELLGEARAESALPDFAPDDVKVGLNDLLLRARRAA